MLVQQETHYHQRQQLVNTIDTSCDLLGRLGLFERDAFIRVQHPQRIPEASLPEIEASKSLKMRKTRKL